MKEVIIYYLLGINLVGFLSMGLDKFKAKKNFWRIKEETLFIIALVGGCIGSIIGMYTFRHKTKHKSFVFGLPAILAIQIGIVCYLLFKY